MTAGLKESRWSIIPTHEVCQRSRARDLLLHGDGGALLALLDEREQRRVLPLHAGPHHAHPISASPRNNWPFFMRSGEGDGGWRGWKREGNGKCEVGGRRPEGGNGG
jgi:hypothetical protein